MKVIITEGPGNQLIGVIDEWAGPVPQRGEYIEHPPFTPGSMPNVMSVKCVTYRMITRPAGIEGVFIAHPEPCIEISV
jgi:hypothetical protein